MRQRIVTYGTGTQSQRERNTISFVFSHLYVKGTGQIFQVSLYIRRQSRRLDSAHGMMCLDSNKRHQSQTESLYTRIYSYYTCLLVFCCALVFRQVRSIVEHRYLPIILTCIRPLQLQGLYNFTARSMHAKLHAWGGTCFIQLFLQAEMEVSGGPTSSDPVPYAASGLPGQVQCMYKTTIDHCIHMSL